MEAEGGTCYHCVPQHEFIAQKACELGKPGEVFCVIYAVLKSLSVLAHEFFQRMLVPLGTSRRWRSMTGHQVGGVHLVEVHLMVLNLAPVCSLEKPCSPSPQMLKYNSHANPYQNIGAVDFCIFS